MATPESDWPGILFGFAIAVMGAFQQFKLPPVLPEMIDRFDHSATLSGAFMSVFAVVGLTLSYRIGIGMRRGDLALWLYAAFGLVMLASLPILFLPEHGWAVLIGRLMEGIAMAVLAVAGLTLMTSRAAPHHVPLAAAIAATWVPMGGLLGTIIARSATLVLPEGAALWPSVWWCGLLLTGIMMALTVWFARNRPQSLRFPSTPTAGTMAAKPDRMIFFVAVCFAFWAVQNVAVLTWLPEYMVRDRGLTHDDAQELYGAMILVFAASNLAGAFALRTKISIYLVLAMTLAGQALVLLIGPFLESPSWALVALFAYPIFGGVTPTCLFALPARLAGPEGPSPASFGMLMTGRNLGVLTGPILIAWIAADLGGWQLGSWTAAGSTVISMFAALAIYRAMR